MSDLTVSLSPFSLSSSVLRRVAGILSVLVCAAFLSACSEDVLTGLDQRDARDAQVLLERAGIRATVTGEKGDVFKIAVDETDHARAIELLSDAGLPRLPHRTMAELFPGDGFLVTPLEQKARMTYAVEQQLGETLSALDGVASARVHIVLPEDNGRGLIKEKARASALLQYRPSANLVDIEMKSRSLLLNSVRGLAYEDVSVVVSPWSEIGSLAGAAPAGAAAEPKQAAAQVAIATATHGLASFLDYRTLSIAGSALLAIAASLILLLPRRKES
ncbi:type III secretion system inner membrane ring lipoprotein SctJ [Rhizobium rhizogenes]|uniref:type III secretion system inner membrane ring lipoprotein SctJ n=1 Tax=Rhizobium rhizogenes TaxID=359 RepID=UPI00157358EB|nr:type III secretion inner membrane ring lipoprotein SctJ [Rhizobium rhizogenes]MCJ9721403.1 type III secretion inner membrane ring lipoprotein SctJ [Agrobacterium sp. BETTINA12B]NTF64702.1 type III secretion inner membrane ring lipoprotein SctJ [Rhizobium rhizogenes]NTG96050.1 type III secretion inner membrane ring lipoprotein SctJ [Rhizobium rhizogenes]NTI37967.1 type III secretion inner membrane ring lipoprotein SctJ [Rhizobium rhizogenes]WEO69401.1 type III secretion inner membrane ring l